MTQREVGGAVDDKTPVFNITLTLKVVPNFSFCGLSDIGGTSVLDMFSASNACFSGDEHLSERISRKKYYIVYWPCGAHSRSSFFRKFLCSVSQAKRQVTLVLLERDAHYI